MTYDELVNQCCRIIIERLCSGSLKAGVVQCIQQILTWKDNQDKSEEGDE